MARTTCVTLVALVAVVVAFFAGPGNDLGVLVLQGALQRSCVYFHSGPWCASPLRREPQPLHVLGAGLGRTGTESLRTALNSVGYKAYHMREVMSQSHMAMWVRYAEARAHEHVAEAKALDAGVECGDDAAGAKPQCAALATARGASEAAADAVLDALAAAGYNATTDFPACLVLHHKLRRYPHARVVLSERSSPEAWADSFRSTIGIVSSLVYDPPFSHLLGMGPVTTWIYLDLGVIEPRGPDGLPAIPPPTRDLPSAQALARAYTRWGQYVRRVVPAEQLLVHEAKQGWPPLCQHLGMAPDECPGTRGEAYPYTNTRAFMQAQVTAMQAITTAWPVLAVLGPALIVALALYLACPRPLRPVAQHSG